MGNLFRDIKTNEIAKRQLRPELSSTVNTSSPSIVEISTVKEILFARTISFANSVTSGLYAINGYTPVADEVVILANQTTSIENGAYIVSSGDWTKIDDLNKYYRFVIETGDFGGYEYRLDGRPIADSVSPSFIQVYPNPNIAIKSVLNEVTTAQIANLNTTPVIIKSAEPNLLISNVLVYADNFTASAGGNIDFNLTDGTASVTLATLTNATLQNGLRYFNLQLLTGFEGNFTNDVRLEIEANSGLTGNKSLFIKVFYG